MGILIFIHSFCHLFFHSFIDLSIHPFCHLLQISACIFPESAFRLMCKRVWHCKQACFISHRPMIIFLSLSFSSLSRNQHEIWVLSSMKSIILWIFQPHLCSITLLWTSQVTI